MASTRYSNNLWLYTNNKKYSKEFSKRLAILFSLCYNKTIEGKHTKRNEVTTTSIISGFHFSEGNKKIGMTLNFNLLPLVTCNCKAECANGRNCYAVRDMKRYPSCKQAWGDNTDLLMNKHEYKLFVDAFCEAIEIHNCRFVRLHSAGDIFSVEYLDALCKVAKKNRSVKFMTYTKQFDILKEYLKEHTIPSNFKIYLSFWNEFQADAELSSKFQIAYYNDFEHESLIDWDSSFTCPGECPKCKFKCWKTKDNVIFNRH